MWTLWIRRADAGGTSLVSSPAGADLLSLSCQRKVSEERRARDGDFPLNFHNRAENGKTRCAQTVPVLFSARLRKSKAPSRAGTAKPAGHLPWRCAPAPVEAQSPGVWSSERQRWSSEPQRWSSGTSKSAFRTSKLAFRTSMSKSPNPKAEVQNSEVRVQNPKAQVQNLNAEVPELQSTRSEPRSTGSELRS